MVISSQITLSVHLVGIVLYLHLPIPGILKVNSFKPYCMHQMQCFPPLDDGITNCIAFDRDITVGYKIQPYITHFQRTPMVIPSSNGWKTLHLMHAVRLKKSLL